MFRVSIFIDGGYLDKILRYELGGVQINYANFSRAIAHTIHPTADILRTYYYHCSPYQGTPPTHEESERVASMQNFLDAINRLPRFTVRQGRLARRGPDREGRYFYEQKMIDVYLSIDLVHASLKGNISHAAIVAGDSDFVPAIEMARNESISVWLFHGERLHNSLWDVADERIQLTQEFINDVLWNPV
ncbi:MAG: NYN domain-containing protein [Anaerolineae bacterium]